MSESSTQPSNNTTSNNTTWPSPYQPNAGESSAQPSQEPFQPNPENDRAYYGYQTRPPSKPKRRWPWFLLGILVGILISVLGFAGCAATIIGTSLVNERSAFESTESIEDGLLGELDPDFDTRLNYDYESLLKEFDVTPGNTSNGVYGAGFYQAGSDGFETGTYALGGTETALGEVYLFDVVKGDPTTYVLSSAITYLGNYFLEITDGRAVVFKPASDQTMQLATASPMEVNEPYESGLYRVGIDIPAGTYTITIQPEQADLVFEDGNEAGAYVMKDLLFNENSMVDMALVIQGSRQTVTVEDGQYIELYGAQATLAP